MESADLVGLEGTLKSGGPASSFGHGANLEFF